MLRRLPPVTSSEAPTIANTAVENSGTAADCLRTHFHPPHRITPNRVICRIHEAQPSPAGSATSHRDFQ